MFCGVTSPKERRWRNGRGSAASRAKTYWRSATTGTIGEMLEFAGSPVLMGNCIAELKSQGWPITLSNDEDGVAAAIRNYALNEESELAANVGASAAHKT